MPSKKKGDAARPGSRVELSVVLPFFNARATAASNLRALAEFLDAQGWDWEIIAVDDGSGDGTAEVLAEAAAALAGVRVLRSPRNVGKGAAIGAAMKIARGERLLFTDGDLPFPLEGVTRIARALADADIAVACRRRPHPVASGLTPWLRGRLSLAFSSLTRAFLLPNLKDTQAGLKGFRRRAMESVLQRQFCTRFGFDLEALVVARRLGFSVVQVELAWRSDDDSTIRLFRDGASILVEFCGIVRRSWTGAYEKPHPAPRGISFVEEGRTP